MTQIINSIYNQKNIVNKIKNKYQQLVNSQLIKKNNAKNSTKQRIEKSNRKIYYKKIRFLIGNPLIKYVLYQLTLVTINNTPIYNILHKKMKLNHFRIRDKILKNKPQILTDFDQQYVQKTEKQDPLSLSSDDKFSAFMQSFQKFMNNFSNNSSQKSKEKSLNQSIPYFSRSQCSIDVDYRDRYIIIDLPIFENNKIELTKLESWIGEVCRQVFSVAFHYYTEQKFTYDQSKIFASQSILRNACLLLDTYQVTSKQIKFIDKKMKQSILPYLKTKYPMTLQKNNKKNFDSIIKEIDNNQALTNDFFYETELEFTYRENGRYDDLIMKFINEIMSKVDMKNSINDQSFTVSNSKDFQNYITQLFQKTYDQKWMNSKNLKSEKTVVNNAQYFQTQKKQQQKKQTQKSQTQKNQTQKNQTMKNQKLEDAKNKQSKQIGLLKQVKQPSKDEIQAQIKNQTQRQKYKLSVQQYTSFLIGRKIPQHTDLYNEDEIRSGNIVIKNSAIMRILTKWCQELWQKFDKQNYYIQRTEALKMTVGKQINIAYPWLKQALKKNMKQEKQNILNFFKEIQDLNYSQHYLLLTNEIENQEQSHINKYQKASGKFACKVVNNFQNFLIIYLNRLIHGLLDVGQSIHKKSMFSMPSWPFPPNLISFKIGDLMRCKYTSKQRQILKIYDEIQKINNQNPQKLKIIRIKNRMKTGTNDILINIKFNNILNCEIQLAINNTKSQFITRSYNFNHYIYELQRSLLGPISELCSIWKNLESRSKQFQKIIERQKAGPMQKQLQNSACKKMNRSQHSLKPYYKPFICFQCSKHYYHSNYMTTHMKCIDCNYWKCAICIIKDNKKSKNIDFFLSSNHFKGQSTFWEKTDSLPNYGTFVQIQKYPLQQIIFKQIKYNQRIYLFNKNGQDLSMLKVISSLKQIQKFAKSCVLFEIKSKQLQKLLNIQLDQAKVKFIIPSYIKKCLQKQKQTISILSQPLEQVDMSVIAQGKQKLKCVKYIEFSGTKLTNLNVLSTNFSNLSSLNLNQNLISDISKIVKFKKLQRLYLLSNQIKQIPTSINQLTQLKDLNIHSNRVQQLPQNLFLLKKLITLNINSNRISSLHENFCNLQNLQQLYAAQNCFKQFPQSMAMHNKLKYITFQKNEISRMPDEIEDLQNLRQLNLSSNRLSLLPQTMKKMIKLQKCNLSRNIFKNNILDVFNSISNWKKLRELNMNSNQIQELIFSQEIQNLKNLQKLNLDDNKIKTLNSSFKHLKSISKLSLQKNLISEISEQFYSLVNLTELKLQKNQIQFESLKKFRKFNKLKILNLNENKLKQLPQQIGQLQQIAQIYLTQANYIIEDFPSCLLKIAKLKVIQIVRQKITIIPQKISNLKCLTILNLGFNSISSINDELGELENLKTLLLYNNRLVQVNSCIFKLINLEHLNLSFNAIKKVDDKFDFLKNLSFLNLSNNKLEVYPSTIGKFMCNEFILVQSNPFSSIKASLLTVKQNKIDFKYGTIKQIIQDKQIQNQNNIEHAKIISTKITQIPSFIFSLSNLKVLNLSGNNINRISGKFENLVRLIDLNLQNNPFEQLPQNFGSLINLKYLKLRSSLFRRFPNSIRNISLQVLYLLGDNLNKIQNIQLVKSKSLNIQNQNLKVLQKNIGAIISLQNIYMINNNLQQFPQQFCSLINLRQIQAPFQKLYALPKNIGNMISLRKINLTLNFSLKEIPQSIALLSNLEYLDLSNNQIGHVPISICKLTNLNTLSMKSNLIQIIPSQINFLKNIEVLNLSGNKIKLLCFELFQLQKLQKLYLQQNLIQFIPKQINKLRALMLQGLFIKQNPIQIIQDQFFVQQKGCKKTKQLLKKLTIKQNTNENMREVQNQ